MEKRVLTIVGPTASGKSKLALILAKKLCTEIISADSRQIYKELTIGTSKPPESDLTKIKHHFINHLSITQKYDVGKFVEEADMVISHIHSQKKIPIVVGGSGLYVNALIYGIFKGPSANEEIRNELERQLKNYGLDFLLKKLEEVDKESFQKIDKKNPRRVIRALEVYFQTGKPISKLQKEKHKPSNYINFIFGLNWNKKKLYERINQRTDEMIKNGLVEEVKTIIEKLGKEVNLVLQTVGYKEVIQYLNNEISLSEVIELIKRSTRRYAKRQMTWFRKDKNILWIDVRSEDDFEEISHYILEKIREGNNERKN